MESTDGYLILQDWFIGAVTRPMYRAWLKMAVAAGEIKLPRGLDMESLYSAVYSGPVMPWIDPVKEANARLQIRGGAATESDWVRASLRNPNDVKARRKARSTKTKRWGWCLTLTLPMTKEAQVPKPKNRAHHRPKASASNSWFRMQASADNEADIYIYDEIGYWGGDGAPVCE